MKNLGKKISGKRETVESYTTCTCSCNCDCSFYGAPDFAVAQGRGIASSSFDTSEAHH